MREKPVLKIAIVSIILMLLIAGIVLLAMFDVKIGSISTLSLKGIVTKKTSIDTLNKKFKETKKSEETKIAELEDAKKVYKTEKQKYQAISDETIAIIEDMKKEEKYFVEYLWVTLGNYAKTNKLKMKVIEPGGKFTSDLVAELKKESEATKKLEDSKKTAGSSSSSTTTTLDTEKKPVEVSSLEEVPEATTETPKSTAVQTSETNTKTPEANANTTGTNAVDNKQETPPAPQTSNNFKIQVRGTYLKVADFVFQVENDKTLRFKLDNIVMQLASGNEIIATFEVKNLVIKK